MCHTHNGGSGLFDAVALDSENSVWLYAVDKVGNASVILSATVMVLDPEGDFDGDGHNNAAEEVAGTDATDKESILRLGLAGVARVANGTELKLVWPSVLGRWYTVNTTSLVTPQWPPLPGLSDLPGSGGQSPTSYFLQITNCFYGSRIGSSNALWSR